MTKEQWKKHPLRRVRVPLPSQTGGFHGTKKGLRGYDRKHAKRELRKEVTYGRSLGRST